MRNSVYSISALLAVTLCASASTLIRAQGQHADYVAALRKAVKNPTDSHSVYRLVIQPEFLETVRDAARRGDESLVVELFQTYAGTDADHAVRGTTALMLASGFGDEQTVKLLLDRGAHVNAKNAEGTTALHEAMGISRPGVIQALLDKGAKVNAKREDGVTPLMVAAEDNRSESLRALLQHGAEVNARDAKGWSALMYAAHLGRLENLRQLLAAGANARLKDKEGKTALGVAGIAPWSGRHDSPGYLSVEIAAEKEKLAHSELRAIQRILHTAIDD